MYVLEKSLVDVEVMEPVEGKVVAMIDPLVYDPEVMGIVGSGKPDKPLMKVVLPVELVDGEAVELAGELVPVWIDEVVEFNPATMEKISWGKAKRSDDEGGINIRIPKINLEGIGDLQKNMHGIRHVCQSDYGIHRITKNRTANDVYINCIVEEGVELFIKGDLYGSMKLLKGSKVSIKGDSYGSVENDGGTLDIDGDVYGPIKNINGGVTSINEDSDIYSPVD
jgi:hypothetical protein